jgi:hypothetical protein
MVHPKTTLCRRVLPGFTLSIFLLGASALAIPSFAAPPPLKRASVEELSGDVIIRKETDKDPRKAALKDIVQGKDVIRTGKKSRAELEFEDRSICRLGSNTVFSFNPDTRDMAFTRGVALVHVPPGKGGARIATPAATAAISGDTVVVRASVMPDGTPATQFTAMSPRGGPTEGDIQITLNSNPNETFVLPAGHIAIVPENATSLSQVPRAEIDVATFAARSPMLQNLPPTAAQELDMVAVEQAKAFESGAAQRTDYAVVGDKVVKADKDGNFTTTKSSSTGSGTGTGTSSQGSTSTSTSGSGTGTTTSTSSTTTPVGSTPLGTFVAAGSTVESTFQQQIFVNGGLNDFGQQTFDPRLLDPVTGQATVSVASLIFGKVAPLTLSGVTFDTSAGTISGFTPGTHYAFQGNRFFFDRAGFSGTITVNGSNPLLLSGEQNSLGSTFTLDGGTTFNFVGAPAAVEFKAEFGDVNFGSNALLVKGDVKLLAPNGGVTTPSNLTTTITGAPSGDVEINAGGGVNATGIIDTRGSLGQDSGTVSITAGNNITLVGSIRTTGSDTTTGIARNGANVTLSSSGDITFSSASPGNLIETRGGVATTGTAGSGGTISITAASMSSAPSSATPASFISSGGDAGTGGTGGNAGNITFTATSSAAPGINLVAGVDAIIVEAQGGDGGNTGQNGNGGIITFSASGGAQVTGIDGANLNELEARAGQGLGAAGTDGLVAGAPTLTNANKAP